MSKSFGPHVSVTLNDNCQICITGPTCVDDDGNVGETVTVVVPANEADGIIERIQTALRDSQR